MELSSVRLIGPLLVGTLIGIVMTRVSLRIGWNEPWAPRRWLSGIVVGAGSGLALWFLLHLLRFYDVAKWLRAGFRLATTFVPVWITQAWGVQQGGYARLIIVGGVLEFGSLTINKVIVLVAVGVILGTISAGIAYRRGGREWLWFAGGGLAVFLAGVIVAIPLMAAASWLNARRYQHARIRASRRAPGDS